MYQFKYFFMLAAVLFASSAHAVLYNFIDLADGTDYGESGYASLTIGTMTADGTKSGADAFPYLDRGNAGLGMCGNVTDLGKQGDSGTNVCLDALGNQAAGDDNVTVAETLSLTFAVDTLVTNLWFNNNHDGGFGIGDQITIEDLEYDAVTGYAGDANAYSTWFIAAGDSLDIAYFNEEFYLSAIEFSTVPAPAIFGLLVMGLAGLGFTRRT